VLWELGAEIVPIAVDPDGFNINKGCGSTSTDYMRSLSLAHNADLGLALDGDADRVMICDEKAQAVDGDQVLGMIARDWSANGRLKGGAVVATQMSNLGLERFLSGHGIDMVRTQVGDRYVVERMREGGYNVGGEQSGHIILGDYSTTGDGLIAALQVLAVIVATGKRASEVCRVFQPLPQVLKNVRFNGGQPLDDAKVKQVIADGESRLRPTGRLVIRKSGTEPLIRVMAEGEDRKVIETVVRDIVGEIERASR
jgi:phosphoglucosamine mutase